MQYLEAITSVHNLNMYHAMVIKVHLEVGHEVRVEHIWLRIMSNGVL